MRRLSPVAVMANVSGGNYLDLINGPQDHGWCDGYTCQQRLSTFHAIVADGKAPFTPKNCESDSGQHMAVHTERKRMQKRNFSLKFSAAS